MFLIHKGFALISKFSPWWKYDSWTDLKGDNI